jgi:hypothetical protein
LIRNLAHFYSNETVLHGLAAVRARSERERRKKAFSSFSKAQVAKENGDGKIKKAVANGIKN